MDVARVLERMRTVAIISSLILLPATACGGDADDPTDPDPEPASTVRVVVSTTGATTDPDGYTVHLGSRRRAIGANDEAVFEDVDPGSHTVELTGVDARCAVAGGATTDVAATADAVAEVAFSVECALFQTVACPAFGLEATSGLPLAEIAIGSLPGSFNSPVAASVSVDGSGHDGFAFIRPGDPAPGEPLRLLVPFHPTTPLEGGTVTVTVSDGARACAPAELTIDPLPPAPGELAAVVDLLQDVLNDQAAVFQTTPDELLATPVGELPQGLWPLAVAQRLLDDPANDRSVGRVGEGSQGAEVTAFLDRIFARTGVRATLEDPPSGAPAKGIPARADPSATQCHPDIVSKSEASVLHECMEAAAEARRRASGVAAKVADDIGEAFSLASELKLPAADVAGEVFGQVFWVIETMRERAAGLYPSSFESMSVGIDKPEIAEDADVTGTVTHASVTATNQGYDLQEEILGALDQALSLAQTVGDFDFSTGTPIVDEVAAELVPLVQEALRETEIEELHIQPETFGPVDVTDPEWIQLRVAVGEAVEVIGGTITYEPRLHGTATLSVRTFDGKFGGAQIAEQVEVVIPEIRMTITPNEITVPPTDPDDLEVVTFTVEVFESVHPDSVDLDLSSHPEQGSAEIRLPKEGSVHAVDYVAPENPDPTQPDLVVVEHTAKSGARAAGPPRTAVATIRFAESQPFVVGGPPCLEPGGQATFEAVGMDGTEIEVTWTASNGTFSSAISGKYTAGDPGEATITATAVVDEERTASTTIRIGTCTCSFRMQMVGDHAADIAAEAPVDAADFDPYEHGEADVALTEAGDLESVIFEGPIFGTVFRGHFLRGDRGPVPVGSLGSFDLEGTASVQEVEGFEETQHFAVVSGPHWAWPEWEPLTLAIHGWGGDLVSGSIQGIVLDAQHLDFERPTFLRIDFLALTKVGAQTASNCNP